MYIYIYIYTIIYVYIMYHSTMHRSAPKEKAPSAFVPVGTPGGALLHLFILLYVCVLQMLIVCFIAWGDTPSIRTWDPCRAPEGDKHLRSPRPTVASVAYPSEHGSRS